MTTPKLPTKRPFQLLFSCLVIVAILLHSTPTNIFAQTPVPTINDVIGPLPVPPGTEAYNQAAGNTSTRDIALIFFISNIIRVITVVAGIWVVFNVIWAGYLYLTQSGKSASVEKVSNLLTMSVLGLLLIVTSYTMAALVGLLVFGDASYIISPQIAGPSFTP